jgi:hypothetical protein
MAKETAAVENKPHTPSTSSHLVETSPELAPTAKNWHGESLATPQSLVPFENEKNSKIHPTSENSPNIMVLSSLSLSITILNPLECSTTTTVLETRPTTVSFPKKLEKLEKLEKPPIFTQTTPPTLAHSLIGHTDNVVQAHTSLQTPNNAVLRPPIPSTTASSPQPQSLKKEKARYYMPFSNRRHLWSLQYIPASLQASKRAQRRPVS